MRFSTGSLYPKESLLKYSKRLFLPLSLVLAVFPCFSSEGQLKCNIGPISKVIGGNPWSVYSCNDDASVVIFSKPESEAHPFYFYFAFSDGQYRLLGEGNGSKEATKTTYEQLETYTEKEISALLAETKQAKASEK